MKKINQYIIIAAALLTGCSLTMQAQSQYGSEFTISLGAGSSTLKYQLQQEQSKPRFGWQLGAGYSHYFSRTIGISLGLEAETFSSLVEMKNILYEQQIQTPPGLQGSFLLQAKYDGLKEKQTIILLQIPVMLQFPVNEQTSFFLGTGLKAGFPVSSKWTQDIATLTTTGYSEYTVQRYENMSNHLFSTTSDVNTSSKLELKSPVLFALEGGLKFSFGEGKYLYAGIFLDYGLNNIYKIPANTALLEYSNDSPVNYNYKSILTTDHYSVSGGIKPFAIGIKFKIGIRGGTRKPNPVWG
jgi:hypothetical protein